MKFEAKYETQEKLTTGIVETLIALDIDSKQKVVVHIFDCQHRSAAPRSEEDLLESFTQLGMQPAGLVIDAGLFDGTSLGYVVTPWPGDRRMVEWLRRYEIAQKAQHPEPAQVPQQPPAGAVRASQPPGGPSLDLPAGDTGFVQRQRDVFSELAAEESPKSPGEFTGLFSPGAPQGARVNRPPSAQQGFPEDFHKLAGSPESKAHAEDPTNPLRTKSRDFDFIDARSDLTTPKVRPSTMESVEAGQFTKLFFQDIDPVEPAVPACAEGSGSDRGPSSGEFTSFFRGPFSGERPAPTPKLAVDFAPKEQVRSDFSKVFGPEDRGSTEISQPARDFTFDQSSEPLHSSTQVFQRRQPVPPSAPEQAGWRPHQPVGPPPPEVASEPWNRSPAFRPSQPTPDTPMAERSPSPGTESVSGPESASPFSEAPSNATRVFSRPEPPSSLEPPPDPTGPSDWTIMRENKAVQPPPNEPAPAPSPSPHAPAWSNAAAGGVPQVPAAPPLPQTPYLPQAPSMSPQGPYSMPQPMGVPQQLSGVPQQSLPTPPISPPVPPPTPAPAPKGISAYMPLIIVLNVLFILAVILVLYFALKH